jgi:molecular chaperone HscB
MSGAATGFQGTPAEDGGVDEAENFFSLFGLEVNFEVDEKGLKQRYRSLQRMAHPDRYAVAEKLSSDWAAHWSARINDGYRTLSDPFERARYLLQLQGMDASGEHAFSSDMNFLAAQMEWRERIDGVTEGDRSRIEQLKQEISEEIERLRQQFLQLAAAGDWPAGGEAVARWSFYRRLAAKVADLEASCL